MRNNLDVDVSFIKIVKIFEILLGTSNWHIPDKTYSLTLWEPVYDIFVLQFQPKKQQFLVALPTP